MDPSLARLFKLVDGDPELMSDGSPPLPILP
jgi:hypothetical protein